MLNVQNPKLIGLGAGTQNDASTEVDVSKLLSMVKRGRRTIVAWIVCLAVLGTTYLLLATPKFTSTSEIIIDTQTSQAMQKQDMTDVSTIDTSLVDSQVEILNSDATAASVVRALNLTTDPEFVGPASGPMGAVSNWIGAQIQRIQSLAGAAAKGPSNLEEVAVAAFEKNLVVKRTGLTYVITITFSSESPVKAARIANAVSEAYLKGVLDAKYAATRQTSQWLQARLGEIRTQATNADRAVELYKSTNKIIDTNRGLMSEQQLGELNSQLATAQAATAEAKARLDRARDVAKDPLHQRTTSETLNNTVISRLRAQYLDLASTQGDFAARFGKGHASVLKLQQQMDQINNAMQNQIKQIIDADESDYEIAQAREKSLQASLDKLVSSNDTSGIAQVKLKDLESSADSYRTIYNNYLQKFQEATQRETFPISDARVVTPATAPLQKSSPKTLIVLGGSLALGFFLGVINVFARQALDDTYFAPDALASDTGLPCLGVLPKLNAAQAAPRGKSGSALRSAQDAPAFDNPADNHALDYPYSRFTETLRNIKVSMDAAGLKVLAVSSALPGEGKTTVSANLAQLLASAGARTLLIDADLTSRSLTARLATRPAKGLLQALETPRSPGDAIVVSSRSTLNILACPSGERIANRPELLASKVFADLLNEARSSYDYVILDMAPIVPVVDARVAANVVDAFLVVVGWHSTSRKVVKEALATDGVRNHTLGVVLNKVDNLALKEVEAYRGNAFSSYYIETNT